MIRLSSTEQLPKSLAKGLPPIIWIATDEPLLAMEAADLVRAKARAAGFTERTILDIGNHFDMSLLFEQARSMSLFAERKLVDIRLGGKPTKELGEVLRQCIASLGDDCRLLVTGGRLERATTSTAWFNALAPSVLLLELQKVDRDRLPEWLSQRLTRQGQSAPRPVLTLIADRTEGNLLAAHQELQRMALLLPPGELAFEQVEKVVRDSARYDIFGLVDTALAGETARSLRMIESLRAQDAPLPLLVWALSDALRRLQKLRQALDGGQQAQSALRSLGIFGKREAAFTHAARRLDGRVAMRLLRDTAHLDRMAKGVGGLEDSGEPAALGGGSDVESQWTAVERIVLGLAGARRLAA
jgi:DNA polymerase-3 subunit delta